MQEHVQTLVVRGPGAIARCVGDSITHCTGQTSCTRGVLCVCVCVCVRVRARVHAAAIHHLRSLYWTQICSVGIGRGPGQEEMVGERKRMERGVVPGRKGRRVWFQERRGEGCGSREESQDKGMM